MIKHYLVSFGLITQLILKASTMQALVDDYIISHSIINVMDIREKGITIGNELIFRRKIIDNFENEWFDIEKFIVMEH